MQETCSGNPASIKRILRQQVGYFFLKKKATSKRKIWDYLQGMGKLGLFTRDGKVDGKKDVGPCRVVGNTGKILQQSYMIIQACIDIILYISK